MIRLRRKARLVFALVTCTGSMGVSRGYGNTAVSWIGTGTANFGAWSRAQNWSPALVPNSSVDDVTLPASSQYVVNLDISPTINSLTLGVGANLNTYGAGISLATGLLGNAGTIEFFSGGTLSASGAVTNSGALYVVNGSTLNANGNVSNSGIFSTSFGPGYSDPAYGNNKVNVMGTFNNTGSLYTIAKGDVVGVNALNNSGQVYVSTGTTLNITGGGTGITDVAAGSYYSIGGSFNVINAGVATSALANLASVEGQLYLNGGQTVSIGGSLTNSSGFSAGGGQIFVQNGTTVSVAGDVNNSGQFDVGLFGSGSNTVNVSGTFNNFTNLTLADQGDVVNVNAMRNYGTAQLSKGATVNVTGGGLSNGGTIRISSGATLALGAGTSSAMGYEQFGTGVLTELIGSADSYGVIAASGSLTLAGALSVSLSNGFTPRSGETFTIITFTPGTRIGVFANIVGTPFPGGQWEVNYDDTGGDVVLEAVPEPATAATLILAGSGTLLRRRHSRRSPRSPRIQSAER